MSPKTHHARLGFTLVEMSLVIVILGMVVAGVLAGREFIATSKIRKDIATIEAVRAAANAFKDKYEGLPGDMTDPGKYFTLDVWHPAYAYGNGNNVIGEMRTDVFAYSIPTIGDSGSTCTACHETTLFWMELAAAQMIELAPFAMSIAAPDNQCTPGKGYPALYANARFGLEIAGQIAGLNYFYYGARQSYAGGQYVTANAEFPMGSVARLIDKKTDDGNPTTGKVRNIVLITKDLPANCNDGTSYYVVDDGTYECGLRIDADF